MKFDEWLIARLIAFGFYSAAKDDGHALRDEGLRTRWIGLDYAGARVALNELEITVTPKIWAGLMTMEQAARDALNGD